MVNLSASNSKKGHTMPITLLGAGNRMRVASIHGNDAIRRHLCDLGFVEGAEVEVIADNGGSLIVGVHGTRLALNADLARRIFV